MAAFLTDRSLSPYADSPTPAPFFPALCTLRRRSIDLSEAFWTFLRAVSEGLMLLWMLATVTFFMLLAAGTIGFLD